MHTVTQQYTLGVEEEYQVVDPVTGALRSAGSTIREADWTHSISPEMQESTIEIGTPICASADEVRTQLCRARLNTAAVAESRGLAIVAAGLHPFSRWEGHSIPDRQRYRDIVDAYGRIAKDEHIFGMHIHVAVDRGMDRLPLMNVLRHYLPLMLALSTSSAFFEGEDTGFASYRTILWRRWPSSGITPRFATQEEYDRYVDLLITSGTLRDRGNVYWSMRPHATYPTIEFRVTDVCPNLDDAVAISALARTLVAAVAGGVLRDDSSRRLPSVLEHELLRVNEWRVARDGLAAEVVNAWTGETAGSVRTAVADLLAVLEPVAAELGDDAALAHIHNILDRGTATDRLREVWRERQSLTAVTTWLQAETLLGVGMDRRQSQRET